MAGVFLNHFSILCSETGSLMEAEAKLAGQRAPGILLSPHPSPMLELQMHGTVHIHTHTY